MLSFTIDTNTQEQVVGPTATADPICTSAKIGGEGGSGADRRCGVHSSKHVTQQPSSKKEKDSLPYEQQQGKLPGAGLPRIEQDPLSPPQLVASVTTASTGSSSGGTKRFSASRIRAGIGEECAAAAAATLPRDDDLYSTLIRFQEEQDDSTTVSMVDTLRSVSTWYSVQSDDDRKIPARPPEGAYDGVYREPIRRGSYRKLHSPSAAAGSATCGSNSSSNGSSGTSWTPRGQGNINVSKGGRFPPPAVATRRTSSGSISRSVMSDPPPAIWELEKDDQTAISSLANNTVDHSAEELLMLNALARQPLGGIDEVCSSSNGNANNDVLSFSAAAQLAQEAYSGNMVETTRSAPTPYGGSAAQFEAPGGSGWGSMEWAFSSLRSPTEIEGQKLPAAHSSSSKRSRRCNPIITATSSSMLMDSSPNAPADPPSPPPMTDFMRMQRILGMQDVCAPGSTNHSLNGSERSSSSLRGNRPGCSQSSSPGQHQSITSSIRSNSSQGTSSSARGTNSQGMAVGQGTPAIASHAVDPTNSVNKAAASNDPTAEEQYKIWKQIQEEQERKQMELALQLSQKETSTLLTEPASGYEYPSQNAKPSRQQQCVSHVGELDEEEALKVALRMSEEEAAAAASVSTNGWQQHDAAGCNGNGGEEEHEIALALRLSKEQAEADQKRFQQMQATAGELSEEEQLRLAMEQSMDQSQQSRRAITDALRHTLHQHNESEEVVDEEMRRALAESLQRADCIDAPIIVNIDDVDEDMMLALRLSQVQMEEEERFRQSFFQPSATGTHADDSVLKSELIQPFSDALPAQQYHAEIDPPVRLRQSPEPSLSGLMPPRKTSRSPARGRWDRMITGGRHGGPPERNMDIPAAIPPHQAPFQDLKSLPLDVRASFEQHQYHGAHPAKIHGPDDGCDMPPISRPQRKDHQGKGNHYPSPYSTGSQINNVMGEMDVSTREVLVREGQSETRAAIMRGQSQIITCRGCSGRLHAPTSCSFVLCPTCDTVTEVPNCVGAGL